MKGTPGNDLKASGRTVAKHIPSRKCGKGLPRLFAGETGCVFAEVDVG